MIKTFSSRFLVVLVTLACATASAEAVEIPPLAAGPERPLTEPGPMVPVEDIRLSAFAGDVAFWTDPRVGSSVFFSNEPTESPELVGEPFMPLNGFWSDFRVVAVGEQYLAIIRSPGRGGPGFFALPLDGEGRPLRDVPEQIWSPNRDAEFDIASRGSDALLVWSEGSSIRTLQLDAAGRLLEWSAPAEMYAGKIAQFAVAHVGDRYVLIVAVVEQGRHLLVALPLRGDGELDGAPVVLEESQHEYDFSLAGGDSRALLVLAEEHLRGVLLESDGTVAGSMAIASNPGLPESHWRVRSISERPGGWTLAWVALTDLIDFEPKTISVAELDSSGNVGFRNSITVDGFPLQLLLSNGASPVLGVSVRTGLQRSEARFYRDESKDPSHSTVSTWQPQTLTVADGNEKAIALLWRDGHFSPTYASPAHLVLIDRLGSREILVEENLIAVAATPDRFFVTRVDPVQATAHKLHGWWVDQDGDLSEPIEITDEYIGGLVQKWSGSQLLSFWSDPAIFRSTLIAGDIYVSSLYPSFATAPSVFWMPGSATVQDADCNENSCLVAWNESDFSDFCEFCPVPSRALVGKTNSLGDLDGSPHLLADGWWEIRLVRISGGAVAVTRQNEAVTAIRLSATGEPIGSFDLDMIPTSTDVALGTIGDFGVIVWEQGGNIVGRLFTVEGEVGPVASLASSNLEESTPRLVVWQGRTHLLYTRVIADLLVPRVFMRPLTVTERRRSVERPR